ncbi:MAG: M23 family metallopeptidase [Candidatus Melainabacteria bacterium]|nr:M23 family metallopeptidase [Candidatus Melainabacteria bacterium]
MPNALQESPRTWENEATAPAFSTAPFSAVAAPSAVSRQQLQAALEHNYAQLMASNPFYLPEPVRLRHEHPVLSNLFHRRVFWWGSSLAVSTTLIAGFLTTLYAHSVLIPHVKNPQQAVDRQVQALLEANDSAEVASYQWTGQNPSSGNRPSSASPHAERLQAQAGGKNPGNPNRSASPEKIAALSKETFAQAPSASALFLNPSLLKREKHREQMQNNRREREEASATVKKPVRIASRRNARSVRGFQLQMPLLSPNISSSFGWRWGRAHQGTDFSASEGSPIYSAGSGTVVYSGWRAGYGYLVSVDHGNGVVTRYAHCSRLYVTPGQSVGKGQMVARVGNTGHSTGPHLHFEIRVDGVAHNPEYYLYGASVASVLPARGNGWIPGRPAMEPIGAATGLRAATSASGSTLKQYKHVIQSAPSTPVSIEDANYEDDLSLEEEPILQTVKVDSTPRKRPSSTVVGRTASAASAGRSSTAAPSSANGLPAGSTQWQLKVSTRDPG